MPQAVMYVLTAASIAIVRGCILDRCVPLTKLLEQHTLQTARDGCVVRSWEGGDKRMLEQYTQRRCIHRFCWRGVRIRSTLQYLCSFLYTHHAICGLVAYMHTNVNLAMFGYMP